MKRLLLAGVALSVATAASAADMQARPYTKAPPAAVSPAYNWSGFYIGAMGGYGWGSGDTGSGGFGGGTVGYNWQFPGSQFVFGVEVDAAGASIKDSFTAGHRRGRPGHGGTQDQLIRQRDRPCGLRDGCGASSTPRAVLRGPTTRPPISVPALGVSFSDSQTHTGYTIGGGLEYLFTPNWSAKGEYMFTSLGGKTYNLGGDLLDFRHHRLPHHQGRRELSLQVRTGVAA